MKKLLLFSAFVCFIGYVATASSVSSFQEPQSKCCSKSQNNNADKSKCDKSKETKACCKKGTEANNTTAPAGCCKKENKPCEKPQQKSCCKKKNETTK